jgi:hypothetical protein
MPAGYEKIRDSLVASGLKLKTAKKRASMIWNKKMAGTGKTVGRGRA